MASLDPVDFVLVMRTVVHLYARRCGTAIFLSGAMGASRGKAGGFTSMEPSVVQRVETAEAISLLASELAECDA